MDGCTAINFVKHVKIGFVQVGVVLQVVLHGGICRSFGNKATIILMHPHCFVYYDKTWTKTVLACFTKMIAEQPYEPNMNAQCYERKLNMLSSTDSNFMILYF